MHTESIDLNSETRKLTKGGGDENAEFECAGLQSQSSLSMLNGDSSPDSTCKIELTKLDHFKWLDHVYSIFPALSTQQDRDKKPCKFLIFVGFTIIANLVFFLLWSIQSFVNTLNDSYSAKKRNIVYPMTFSLAFLLKIAATLILVLKFYPKQFNPSWHKIEFQHFHDCNCNCNCTDNHNNTSNKGDCNRIRTSHDQCNCHKNNNAVNELRIINKTNKRLQFWWKFAILLTILQGIRNITEYILGIDPEFHDCIGFFFDMYCIEIPSIIGQFELTIMFLKITLKMDALNESINSKKSDALQLLDQYKQIEKRFNNDYKILFTFIVCKILAILLWLWITLTNYKITFNYTENDDISTFIFGVISGILWTCWNFIVVLEFIIAGDAVTTSYYTFKNKIFNIVPGSGTQNNNDNNNNNESEWNSLKIYATNYTMTAKFIKNGNVSIENTKVFFVVFIVGLFAQYQILN